MLDTRIKTLGLWRDFHGRFVPVLSDWLRRNLPPSHRSFIEERVYLSMALQSEVRERYAVARTRGGDLVSVVELFSPANKRPGREGRDAYLVKRRELLQAGVHLVEIDLLMDGERMPLAQPWPPCDRSVLVVRARYLSRAELYPFDLNAPLPTVRLPLRSPDPDLPLQLQAILEETWLRGSYDRVLADLEESAPPEG